jgi:ornithine decarboxylase
MTALAALGAGFDCASQTEVALAVRAGVDVSTRVIYANPCKKPSELEAMRRSGCDLTTYDSVEELEKIAAIFPGCRVVVRIAACDPEARCQLGNKYGAPAEEWERLIDAALEHGLPLVGVAFHVGSGSRAPAAFAQAIADAKVVFDLADARGLNLEILDIGGGFMPDFESTTGRLSLGDVPAAINAALDEHFPAHAPDAPRVIAEPGRFFAQHAAIFATQVIGTRQRATRKERELFIADGLYGSFNCVFYDGVVMKDLTVLPTPKRDGRGLKGDAWLAPAETEGALTIETDVFGPTCDGLDQVLSATPLPRGIELGDWLLWPSFGAYTLTGASNFNGFHPTGTPSVYVYSAPHIVAGSEDGSATTADHGA